MFTFLHLISPVKILFLSNEKTHSYSSEFSRPDLLIASITVLAGEVIQLILNYIPANMRRWPKIVYCWASVVDGWPTVNQRWNNVSCLLGATPHTRWCRGRCYTSSCTWSHIEKCCFEFYWVLFHYIMFFIPLHKVADSTPLIIINP